jgi:hypothetical protein
MSYFFQKTASGSYGSNQEEMSYLYQRTESGRIPNNQEELYPERLGDEGI